MNTQSLSPTAITHNNVFQNSIDLVGRIALGAIFLIAGINKISQYEGTAQYMTAMGVNDILLPAVIAFEIGAALLLFIGLFTRLTALAFAGFCTMSAIIFHSNLGDQIQFLMFFKNIAIAGGFLVLASHGAGEYSLDHKRQK